MPFVCKIVLLTVCVYLVNLSKVYCCLLCKRCMSSVTGYDATWCGSTLFMIDQTKVELIPKSCRQTSRTTTTSVNWVCWQSATTYSWGNTCILKLFWAKAIVSKANTRFVACPHFSAGTASSRYRLFHRGWEESSGELMKPKNLGNQNHTILDWSNRSSQVLHFHEQEDWWLEKSQTMSRTKIQLIANVRILIRPK